MIKKILLFCISFLLFLPFVHGETVTLQSPYAILYNLNDDTILFENHSEEEIPIASLTKIMTTLVAIEHIPSLEDTIVLTPNVFYGLKEANASVAEFRIGQKVTYLDLLYGSMLPSGADATQALAISLAGNVDNYVAWMNEKAIELELSHTHYVNTTGLDAEGHYSTVKEVATLLKKALENDLFRTIFTTKEYTTSDGTLHFKSTLLKMHEKYNVDIANILGAKTGFTNQAGSCLASIARNNHIEYLLVTAGIDSKIKQPLHILDALNTYQYYFTHYDYYPVLNIGDYITTVEVEDSTIPTLEITSPIAVYEFLNKDDLDLHMNYIGMDKVDPNILKGANIGNLQIYNHGKLLQTIEIQMPITLEKSIWNPIIKYGSLVFLLMLAVCMFLLGRKKYVQSRNR